MKDTLKKLKALSDETRLRIINLLGERDCCVCEVMAALEISQTRASRHLQALYEAGLLRHWKEGLWSHYGIDEAEGAPELVRLVRQSLQNDPQAAADVRKLAEAAPVACGPACARGRA